MRALATMSPPRCRSVRSGACRLPFPQTRRHQNRGRGERMDRAQIGRVAQSGEVLRAVVGLKLTSCPRGNTAFASKSKGSSNPRMAIRPLIHLIASSSEGRQRFDIAQWRREVSHGSPLGPRSYLARQLCRCRGLPASTRLSGRCCASTTGCRRRCSRARASRWVDRSQGALSAMRPDNSTTETGEILHVDGVQSAGHRSP